MKRIVTSLIALAAICMLMLAGCGSSSTPLAHLWVGPNTRLMASVNAQYDVTFYWSNVTFPSQTVTGYYVYVNGSQVADVSASPYIITGLTCTTSYTFGVAAHNSSGTAGPRQSSNYTTGSCSGGGGSGGGGGGSGPFPLAISSNGRYLVDAQNNPWLIVGDSPQDIVGNLSTTNADNYFDDRKAEGFNTVWDNLLCAAYTECNSNGTAVGDGSGVIAPFTSGSGPASYTIGTSSTAPYCTTCNATYFNRAKAIYAHAQTDGIEIFLDPLETGNNNNDPAWDAMLNANGNGTLSTTDGDYRYGQYLGTEFASLPNILWLFGNDFQNVSTNPDSNNLKTVLNGLLNTDPSALYTVETDFNGDFSQSTSLTDVNGIDTTWDNFTLLDSIYTYSPAFDGIAQAISEAPTMPAYIVESNYEGQKNGSYDGCQTIRNCRLQEWWTMTSGGAGTLYGGNYLSSTGTPNDGSFGIMNGFTNADIDTPGATQLGYQTSFLKSIAWQTLKPDTAHHVVTAGTGTCDPQPHSIAAETCVTTGSNYPGSGTGNTTLAVSYLPDPSALSTITVNLGLFAGPVNAQWYDPTNGVLGTPIAGSPFNNNGTQNFTPTGNNSAGDKDWVLLLTSTNGSAPTNVSPPTITGTTTQGQTLTVNSNGTWNNSPTSFAYQWQDCNSSGASCVNISGATTSTYILQASDVGDTIKVVVTATNASGNGSATSAATTVVAAGGSGVPVNSTAPVINGGPTPNSELDAQPGTWTNTPTSYTYQWQDCTSGGSCTNASNTSGLTGDTCSPTAYCYVISSGEASAASSIRVVVTAHNASGAASANSGTSVTAAPYDNVSPFSNTASEVNCPLTQAGGNDPNASCWATHTGVLWATGCTEAQIKAQGAGPCGPVGNGSGGLFTKITTEQDVTASNTLFDHVWFANTCVDVMPGANNVTVRDSLFTGGSASGAATCSNVDAAGALFNTGQDDATGLPTIGLNSLVEDSTFDGGTPANGDNPIAPDSQDSGISVRINTFGYSKGFLSMDNNSAHPEYAQDVYSHNFAGCVHDDGTWFDGAANVTFEHGWVDTGNDIYLQTDTSGGCATGALTGGSDTTGIGANTGIVFDRSFGSGGFGKSGGNGGGGEDTHSGCLWTQSQYTNNALSTANKDYGSGFDPNNAGTTWINNYSVDVNTGAGSTGTTALGNPYTGECTGGPLTTPVAIASPNVTGTATVGSTLTTSNGTWNNNPTSFTYQWQDCNSIGASCTNVSGATSSSYVLQSTDATHTMDVIVTGHATAGTGTATSINTAVVH